MKISENIKYLIIGIILTSGFFLLLGSKGENNYSEVGRYQISTCTAGQSLLDPVITVLDTKLTC
jgi:hypothetical protein